MDERSPTLDRSARLPQAARVPLSRTVHGVAVTDDFAWLRAENWREVLADSDTLPAPIRAHLASENAYASHVLAACEPLRRELVAEMRGRIKEDEASVPTPDGLFFYYSRYRPGAQHPLVCRKARSAGEEQILLDADRMAEGKPFFELAATVHAPDHRFLAWAVDDTGAELNRLRVRDLVDGTDLDEVIEETSGEVVWGRDSRFFYYVRLDAEHRPAHVFRHRLGTPAESDVLVYSVDSPTWFVHVSRTQSGAYGLITVSDQETSETYLLDLADPDAQPRLVAPRESEILYAVEHHGEALVILTNADGAEDFKIVTAPLADPGRQNWRDLVPARTGVMIRSHVVLARHLVRLEQEDALPRIVVRDLARGEEHAIAFDEEAFALHIEDGYEFETTTLRFTYESMTRPVETYDYDLVSRQRTLRKRQEIPSGHDPALYVTRRLFATAHDGEAVPISLVHRRDLALDGSAPCLLYGYGAYGFSMQPWFDGNALSLVDRGFVYAIAHVRGGTERGWRWYKDGKREKKPNTFRDFIAVAEKLAFDGYTRVGRIVAHGGSAGGMLMGAVANLAPHLFAGIVAEVPFVDVLNTMLDAELPLTPPEWLEWGNPIEDPDAFERLRGYSPYEQVSAQTYPAILAMTGLSDPRVTYWEPAKWVAKLRATMTGGGPILLKTNMDAGHGGAPGRFERLEEIALVYAFAIAAVEGRLA